MAASSAASLSSKMSSSIRLLLLRKPTSTARSTAIASTAAFSLTGKPVAVDESNPTLSLSDDNMIGLNDVSDVRKFGRLDWPVLGQRVSIEAAARGGKRVVDSIEDDDEEFDEFDDDDEDFDEDNIDDLDEFDDEVTDDEEIEVKRKRK